MMNTNKIKLNEDLTAFMNRLAFLGDSLEEKVNVSLAISLLPVNRHLWQRQLSWPINL